MTDELTPLLGTKSVRTSEPAERQDTGNAAARDADSRPFLGDCHARPCPVHPGPVLSHPISVGDARMLALAHVGRTKSRYLVRWREEWWDHLRVTPSPEERLTCERMINALNFALGMNDPDAAIRLAEINRRKAEEAEVEAGKAREAAAVERWR